MNFSNYSKKMQQNLATCNNLGSGTGNNRVRRNYNEEIIRILMKWIIRVGLSAQINGKSLITYILCKDMTLAY